jgi:HEAT repeat protein
MICTRLFSVVIALGGAAWLSWAGGPGLQKSAGALTQDEQALKDAGIALDGPSLLAYFRRRTPSEDEQAALKQQAAQLGDSRFQVRMKATDELIRAGRSALPFLRETAKQRDAETSRRALYCIQVIEQNTRIGLAATAGRVLAERNQPGAVEALLAYLPFIAEPWVEEEIRYSLKKIAYTDGKAVPALEQALGAKEAKRRAAAAWLVGASIDARQRGQVIERLTDTSSEVRFHAAAALLAAHEAKAVPVLIALLTPDSPELAQRAEDLLFRVAGENAPPVWLDTASDNQGKNVRAAWDSWWKANQTKIDWQSLRLDEQSIGLTLIAETQRPDGSGRLFECNKAGEIRWQIPTQNPIDAQWIPGGRLLIADARNNQIYEMDTRGNIGWKHTGIAPTSVQRLPNGNTVVSTYRSIVELTREGKTVFAYTTQGHTYHARKLPDGHYIWIDASGEIGEIDEKGKLLVKTKVGAGLAWGSVERLRNGRYLVALGGVGKVQEVDVSGKVFWERNVANPNRAVRLVNGHTLVASHGDGCIYEFDANGNERWKHACVGRPFAAQRR